MDRSRSYIPETTVDAALGFDDATNDLSLSLDVNGVTQDLAVDLSSLTETTMDGAMSFNETDNQVNLWMEVNGVRQECSTDLSSLFPQDTVIGGSSIVEDNTLFSTIDVNGVKHTMVTDLSEISKSVVAIHATGVHLGGGHRRQRRMVKAKGVSGASQRIHGDEDNGQRRRRMKSKKNGDATPSDD